MASILPISIDVTSPLTKASLLLYTIFNNIVSNVNDNLTVGFNNTVSNVRIVTMVFTGGVNMSINSFIVTCGVILCIMYNFVLRD